MEETPTYVIFIGRCMARGGKCQMAELECQRASVTAPIYPASSRPKDLIWAHFTQCRLPKAMAISTPYVEIERNHGVVTWGKATMFTQT
jgi:hypothetical protein